MFLSYIAENFLPYLLDRAKELYLQVLLCGERIVTAAKTYATMFIKWQLC